MGRASPFQRASGVFTGIEDTAYFPPLAQLEQRFARGFSVLDADHHALHKMIDTFASGANAVRRAGNDTAQHELVTDFDTVLGRIERPLGQHLGHEDDLVLPVVLKQPGD